MKTMRKIGVSQKAIIFNKDGKILAIRSSKTHPFYPLFWDLPGGDIEFGEDAEKSIIREIKEETGLGVKNLQVFDVESHTHKDKNGEIFWVTISYKAEAVSKKITLSYEHDKFQWLTPQKFLKLKSSKKLKRFVKNLKK